MEHKLFTSDHLDERATVALEDTSTKLGDVNVGEAGGNRKLTPGALKKLLDERVEMMKEGKNGNGITDQYRVYCHIIENIAGDNYLRMMVQGSAGTGKVLIFFVSIFVSETT